jgi:hypothetical protein
VGRFRFNFAGPDNFILLLIAPQFWSPLQTSLFYVFSTVTFTMESGSNSANMRS